MHSTFVLTSCLWHLRICYQVIWDWKPSEFLVKCVRKCWPSLPFRGTWRLFMRKKGKIWGCVECGKILQDEKRLTQHQTIHNPQSENPSFFYCQDCNYKTKCKDYLVDHRRLMHNQTGNGQYICISGKCSKKPISFPNQPRLDKHKTCHASEKCEECGKIFGAKRNLKRHKKKKAPERASRFECEFKSQWWRQKWKCNCSNSRCIRWCLECGHDHCNKIEIFDHVSIYTSYQK